MILSLLAETPLPLKADLITGILLVGSIILGFLLRRRPKDSGVNRDDTPSQTATRGEPIAFIKGRRRVGSLVGWVGSRRIGQEGGGGKGFGSSPGQDVFFEKRWDIICIGPASKCWGIYESGELIKEAFDAQTYPSGSTLTTENGEDSFVIYWGENNQSQHPALVQRTGVASRHPNLCYIFWDEKRLGGGPTWSQIEYDMEVLCDEDVLGGIENIIGTGNARGMNPALVFANIWASAYPQGLGFPIEELDRQSFLAWATDAEAEQFVVNIISEGASGKDILGALLSDSSVVCPQVGEHLTAQPIRPITANIPVLGDIAAIDEPEIISLPEGTPTSRIILTFNDVDNQFRDMDIKVDNDAQSEGSFDESKTSLDTVTTLATANIAMPRKMLEEFGVSDQASLTAGHAARRLIPGDVVSITGLGISRVSEVLFEDFTDRSIGLKVVQDIFSASSLGYTQEATTPGAGGLLDVAADFFTFSQVPTEKKIVIFRTRAHNQIVTANTHLSLDGTTYSLSPTSQATSAFGGLLTTSLATGTASPLDVGPIFAASNSDATSVSDLSSSTAAWEAGQQVALLQKTTGEQELIYPQSITVQAEDAWASETAYSLGDYISTTTAPGLRFKCITAGTSGVAQPTWAFLGGEEVSDGTAEWVTEYPRYLLNDILRAKEGSSQTAFSAGDRVWIIAANNLQVVSDPLINSATTLYLKTQPATSRQVQDLSTVVAVSRTIT